MECKHKSRLSDVGFCRTASMYCTFEQESTCKRKQKLTTEADRIRAMSDEELVIFFTSPAPYPRCDDVNADRGRLLNWLQQPVEEG